MASLFALEPIAIILISFLVGFAFYYMVSSYSKKKKKKHLEEITSLLISFVIFIWIGKILLNLKLFISDPLVVLAYPSNSKAFYIALLFILINIGYKVMRHQFDIGTIFGAFVPVFLVASFVYEFIEIIWNKNTYMWGYLGFLTVLVIVFMLLYERIRLEKLGYILMIAWAIGMLLFTLFRPFTTVFSYMMSWWVIVLLLIFMLSAFIYRRKVLSWVE